MRVAGIDGSTKSTGIAIMNDGELEFYTLINLHKEKDAMLRIQKMGFEICKILDEYEIDKVYMEKSMMKGGNVDTLQKLSNLAGSIMLYCYSKEIDFIHPLPSQWRKIVGIQQSSKVKREVLKEEAIYAVEKEYGISVGDDIAEAILLSRSAFNLPTLDVHEDDLWESH